MDELKELFDTAEFYQLMQVYRHSPLVPQEDVVEAFEAVKTFIVKAIYDAGYREVPSKEELQAAIAKLITFICDSGAIGFEVTPNGVSELHQWLLER